MNVIQWRLRDVMDSHNISATSLAEKLGVSKNAVSNLRGVEMPRINGDRLNSLVLALNALRRANTDLITPADLIQFSLTTDEMKALGVK
jgi:DNA-binding Xre family transcriptional regulator